MEIIREVKILKRPSNHGSIARDESLTLKSEKRTNINDCHFMLKVRWNEHSFDKRKRGWVSSGFYFTFLVTILNFFVRCFVEQPSMYNSWLSLKFLIIILTDLLEAKKYFKTSDMLTLTEMFVIDRSTWKSREDMTCTYKAVLKQW